MSYKESDFHPYIWEWIVSNEVSIKIQHQAFSKKVEEREANGIFSHPGWFFDPKTVSSELANIKSIVSEYSGYIHLGLCIKDVNKEDNLRYGRAITACNRMFPEDKNGSKFKNINHRENHDLYLCLLFRNSEDAVLCKLTYG
jgi:hypothetical protein